MTSLWTVVAEVILEVKKGLGLAGTERSIDNHLRHARFYKTASQLSL